MVDFKGSIQWLHYQKKAFERRTWGSRCYFYNLLLPKPFCLLFLIFIWIASALCFLAEVLSKIQSNNFQDQAFNSSLAVLSCEAFNDLQTRYNSANVGSSVKLDRILISLCLQIFRHKCLNQMLFQPSKFNDFMLYMVRTKNKQKLIDKCIHFK